ncbi:sensor histidine kinase N-terminal domain-containing protein [Rhodoferax sp. GW822-FHT02A01]|uniref:sensor histidine kinase n=1 Tax=Rhodoferax sp. GW822-FHT02A01 TaxID=3141537 RepID=UPI00315CB0F8
MTRSLKGKLLTWVLFPLLGAVGLNMWVNYRSAVQTATVVQDRLLQGSARIIAEQIRFEDGSFQHLIPPAALELFQSEDVDRIFYKVTVEGGQLLSGYTDLARPEVTAPQDTPFFFNSQMRGKDVRVVALWQPVIGNPTAAPAVVEVAQTTNARQQLIHKLWLQSVVPQLFILAMTMVLIVFGLNRGLLPLRRLRDVIHSRKPGTLEPVIAHELPNELTPLVDSLNDYIRRLEEHVNTHEVFIQNAAHQLRTPFAVLSTQLSYAMRNSQGVGHTESLAAARRTLSRAIRLVNQLLSLSLAQTLDQNKDGASSETTQLTVVVQEVLENLAGLSQEKNIDLGFEDHGDGAVVQGRSLVISEMVMNLVDNAIRYTPSGGHVTVRLHSTQDTSTLVVEDSGPGIAPELREKVFERFFRIDNHDSQGSGLGLSIVRAFAERTGAKVSLDTIANGSGLRACLQFCNAQV